MKKEDLKNGTIIQLRNGHISVVKNGYFTMLYNKSHIGLITLKEYNDDLTHKFDSRCDIMKITHAYSYSDGVIWDEERDEILLNSEREYLSAVIAPFRERVARIEKKIANTAGYEFIKITVRSGIKYYDREYIYLPLFNMGAMYKRMKQEKEYTLEELNL